MLHNRVIKTTLLQVLMVCQTLTATQLHDNVCAHRAAQPGYVDMVLDILTQNTSDKTQVKRRPFRTVRRPFFSAT